MYYSKFDFEYYFPFNALAIIAKHIDTTQLPTIRATITPQNGYGNGSISSKVLLNGLDRLNS